MSLFISGVSSKWFSVQLIDGIENAAISIVPEEYLSPLPRGATRAMIKRMSRVSGLILSEPIRDRIAEVSGDMPFWVRKSCSYIHRHIKPEIRPYEPSLAEIDKRLLEFVESEGAVLAHLALSHLFTVYPELETGVLSCYDNDGVDCSRPVLEKLRKYGIISRDRESDMLSGNMMRAGFEQYLEERTRPSLFQATSYQTNNPLEDWADDLAIVNKKRNILEKKLRDVALYFLNFDSLHNKGRGDTKRRLLKALTPKKREAFERESSEKILENFTWSELVTLINREWSLFDPIFQGNRFKMNLRSYELYTN